MKTSRIFFVIAFLISTIACSCGSSDTGPAGYYTDGNGNEVIVYSDKTWTARLTEESPLGDITYNYTGIIDDKNMMVIKTGETRRAIGDNIVEFGNYFGIIEGDHIKGGMSNLSTIWTKDKEKSKTIPQKSEFNTAKSGLRYKFTELYENNRQVNAGDCVMGTLTITFNEETLYQQLKPDMIAIVHESDKGDFEEGLLMMHVGDRATFEVDADMLCQAMGQEKMPASYEKGAGMKFVYTVHIMDVITKEEIEKEREAAR
ncbi:MAG: hypothetical protein IJM88_01130 [Bacteroidales bacterium]|nr:hypothetical protein [Bacteroidales bacterium]